jgi:DNA processing protein
MTVDPVAAGVALASLSSMGPRRFGALVRVFGFADAWEAVRGGRSVGDRRVAEALGPAVTSVPDTWRAEALRLDPAALVDVHRAAGIDITLFGSDRYPSALAADLEPPMVLFSRGSLDVIRGPRVGIVGTRRCTRGGRLTAREMGAALAEAGVAVVSGLALGIDGAAHEGVLASAGPAPPIGVVGTGLDVVYPRRHQGLWDAVADRGVLLSEVPLGGRSAAWRFPARNRTIAALSDLLVVVESHARGGALHTVDEAHRRGRPIVVVPGSVRSPASDGTNALLHEGAGPVRDAADVLIALGFTGAGTRADDDSATQGTLPLESRRVDEMGADRVLDPADRVILDQLGGEPVSIDQLTVRCDLDLGELAVRLLALESEGRVSRSGSWIERTRR